MMSTSASSGLLSCLIILGLMSPLSQVMCRLILVKKLLALFADLALVAQTRSQMYDLGSLLPIIAATSHADEAILQGDAQLVKVCTDLTELGIIITRETTSTVQSLQLHHVMDGARWLYVLSRLSN